VMKLEERSRVGVARLERGRKVAKAQEERHDREREKVWAELRDIEVWLRALSA